MKLEGDRSLFIPERVTAKHVGRKFNDFGSEVWFRTIEDVVNHVPVDKKQRHEAVLMACQTDDGEHGRERLGKLGKRSKTFVRKL